LTATKDLERRGAYGIDWRLTMGHVTQMGRYACAGLNNLLYEDAWRTLLLILLSLSASPGNTLNGHTTDWTLMRSEANLKSGVPPSVTTIVQFRIYLGNGVILSLDSVLLDTGRQAANPDVHGGGRLSRIENIGPGGQRFHYGIPDDTSRPPHSALSGEILRLDKQMFLSHRGAS
jgi:hypothetical protein